MYPKEVREIFSDEEIEQLKEDGYSERDLIGLALFKRMIDMGLTDEEMDMIFFQSFTETIEEYCGSEAAEELNSPVIMQTTPSTVKYADVEFFLANAKVAAEKANVPIAMHLDHGNSFELAIKAFRAGYTSVMIDGSTKSFQENVELTKNVVRVAKVFGVDVEAELGHVGNGDSIDAIDNTNYYTKVEDAVRFVEQTGCDSLAIAVGNAHGPYVKTPNLDLERIYAIRKKVNIPLVLHGCSDIPEEQMKEAVNLGMSKFNIATEYFRTMYQSIEKRINNQEFEGNGVKLMYDIKEEMIDFVIQKIRLLNPNKYSM